MEVNTNGGEKRWSPAGVSALNWMMLISLVDVSSPSRLSECHLLLPVLPQTLFLTLGFLPDPESPPSSGCFNKFIRVKLTHWIKSDRAESCSAAGLLCNSAVQILHLLSLALVQPRLHLQGFFILLPRRTSGPSEAETSKQIKAEQQGQEPGWALCRPFNLPSSWFGPVGRYVQFSSVFDL